MVSVVRFDRQQNTAGTTYNHHVQTVFTSWTNLTTFTTANTYQTLTGGSLTITPLYTGSKFHIVANVQCYTVTSGGLNVGINRTIAGATTRLVGVDGSSGDTWAATADGAAPYNSNSATISRFWLDSPGVTAGTPITYQALGGMWSSGTAYFGYSGYAISSTLTIWEIQA
jgi:hypothetical protein